MYTWSVAVVFYRYVLTAGLGDKRVGASTFVLDNTRRPATVVGAHDVAQRVLEGHRHTDHTVVSIVVMPVEYPGPDVPVFRFDVEGGRLRGVHVTNTPEPAPPKRRALDLGG